MSLIEIRKRCLIVETTYHEGGPVVDKPLKLAAACAVIRNPYAGHYEPDLMPFMAELRSLGTLLAQELVDTLGKEGELSFTGGKLTAFKPVSEPAKTASDAVPAASSAQAPAPTASAQK